jgi:NitT/TauT family transport system permease protein
MKLRHHYSHHGHQKKKISLLAKINLHLIIPLFLIIISGIVIGFTPHALAYVSSIPWSYLLKGLGVTFIRLVISYLLALIIGIPLAIWTQVNQRVEQVLLPIFDTLESVPVLVFFPVIIIGFINIGLINSAAIFIIFLSMIWTIVFSVIGGLKSIPQDIYSVAHVFKITGLKKLFQIIIPSIIPTAVTGSILAWAAGWNMIIVAEVLQTYIPTTLSVKNLFGIGSILVDASANSHKTLFLAAVAIIVATIMILNLFVWQKLLRYSERFKFE